MFRSPRILLALGVAALSAPALGQDNATPNLPAAPSVLGSHQIDRYEAIKQLTASLKQDPKNLSDWVILGELSQEVATEVPNEQAKGYFRLARESYDNALKLAPDNAGLKAAAQFARDQEANADQFNDSRKQATTGYLDARRREMAQTDQPVPTVRVFTPPTNAPQTPQAGQATYPQGYPVYRPYTTAQGQPYTYNQYQNGFNTANAANTANTTAQPPMTLRQYTQQLPNILGNEVLRQVAPGAARPGAAAAGAVKRP